MPTTNGNPRDGLAKRRREAVAMLTAQDYRIFEIARWLDITPGRVSQILKALSSKSRSACVGGVGVGVCAHSAANLS